MPKLCPVYLPDWRGWVLAAARRIRPDRGTCTATSGLSTSPFQNRLGSKGSALLAKWKRLHIMQAASMQSVGSHCLFDPWECSLVGTMC